MKNYLTIDEIYSNVCALAQSQGFYGSVKTFIEENSKHITASCTKGTKNTNFSLLVAY